MTERDVRAMLRGATKAKILTGWYAVGRVGDRMYIIAPAEGTTESYFQHAAEAYCGMLIESGVEPLYRDSEPDWEA